MDVGHLRVTNLNKVGVLMANWPTTRIEEQHDSGVPVMDYLGAGFRGSGRSLPPLDHIEGDIYAELERGLWIARCPEEYCFGACAVTSLNKINACPSCGAGWFNVIFPENKAAIEKELMKRPIPRVGLIFHNWRLGESMAQLRAETKAGRDV